MGKDLSIIYNAKLQKVKDDLEQLKEINFDVSKIEKTITDIEEKVDQKITENYSIFDKQGSKAFLHDTVGFVYEIATAKLEKIEDEIKEEYESYSKINNQYLALKKMIANVDENNASKIIQKGIQLLDSIRASSTIDYNIEKKLVENIYQLVYKIIKIELICGKETAFLDKILTDDTDLTYLVKLVKENIKEIPKKSRTSIDNIIERLEIDGTLDDYNYLNKELLTEIIITQDNSLIEKINRNFQEKYAAYKEVEEEYYLAIDKNNELISNSETIKQDVKHNRFLRIRKISSLYVNMLLLTAGIATSVFALKKPTSEKVYLTTTQTYDSLTGEKPPKETYEKDRDDTVTLVEYSPWESPGYFRTDYKRNEYYYDLSTLEEGFEELKDYLNPKLKGEITYVMEEKNQEEKPDDYGYQENKYVITKVEQNKDKFDLVPREELWALAAILSSIGITIIDLLVYSKLISKEKYFNQKFFYQEAKNRLKENNQRLIEMKNKIEDLKLQLATLKSETLCEYESLPSTLKESPKVKEKVNDLKNENNS